MRQCENCIHAMFSKGAERGVMDCDPDEYWCNAHYDEIFDYDDEDEDILEVLDWYGYVPKAEDDIKEFIENFTCPGFVYRYDDNEPDPDEWYDRMKDEGTL